MVFLAALKDSKHSLAEQTSYTLLLEAPLPLEDLTTEPLVSKPSDKAS